MNTVPQWRLAGDWFDICSCNIPCPCEFAQAPTNNACSGHAFVWLTSGRVTLAMLDWTVSISWRSRGSRATFGRVRRPGWDCSLMRKRTSGNGRHCNPSLPARLVAGPLVGLPCQYWRISRRRELVPISFRKSADDLAHWQAEIPGRVRGRAEALTGPTTPPGKRVQTINPPGSGEVGPGAGCDLGSF